MSVLLAQGNLFRVKGHQNNAVVLGRHVRGKDYKWHECDLLKNDELQVHRTLNLKHEVDYNES